MIRPKLMIHKKLFPKKRWNQIFSKIRVYRHNTVTSLLHQKEKSVKSVFQKGKEKWKPIEVSSDSKEFSSPAIMKSHFKFKMKRMNEMPVHSICLGLWQICLKLPGATQSVFKSVVDTKVSENFLTFQNQKFSDNTSFAQTISLVPSQERICAFDGSNNSNININTNYSLNTKKLLVQIFLKK